MSIIQLKNINKSYEEKNILNKYSLEIKQGEMVAIVGASGSGKSTILNILGLLEKFDSGEYIIDGDKNVEPNSSKATKILRNKINYLFQNFALVDEETVFYNLKLALKYTRKSNKEKKYAIREALNQVGLEGYENKKIYKLSGGEQQRIAIARSILKPCKIILADEPTGSLDEDNVKIVLSLLRNLNKDGKTIIVVTHDKSVAESCDKIVSL